MKDPAAVRALTFDCYGTLIDWDAGIRAYLRRLLDAKGRGRSTWTASTITGITSASCRRSPVRS